MTFTKNKKAIIAVLVAVIILITCVVAMFSLTAARPKRRESVVTKSVEERLAEQEANTIRVPEDEVSALKEQDMDDAEIIKTLTDKYADEIEAGRYVVIPVFPEDFSKIPEN